MAKVRRSPWDKPSGADLGGEKEMGDGRRSVLPRANVPALPTRRLLGPQLWVAHAFGNEPAEDKFVAPSNRGVWVKPTGGMWTSTYLGPEEGSDWVRWCRGENFANPDTAAWYVLTPRRGLRILRIDTVADLSRATSAYPASVPDDWPDILRKDLKLDYEALAADGWDAIYLTYLGQRRTRFSRPGLYGWGSGCAGASTRLNSSGPAATRSRLSKPAPSRIVGNEPTRSEACDGGVHGSKRAASSKVSHPILSAAMFSEKVLADTAHWAGYFGREWQREVPLRIHSRDIGNDGAPAWHPDFEKWITGEKKAEATPQPRLRTTKAMRRLRKIAPREYEVMYRLLILGDSIQGITVWLNDRAVRNNIELPEGRAEHYRLKDTLALIVAGTDHVKNIW